MNNIYKLREVQNVGSTCTAREIRSGSLHGAKRSAERYRIFVNTVLLLDAPSGIRHSKINGKWVELGYYL